MRDTHTPSGTAADDAEVTGRPTSVDLIEEVSIDGMCGVY
ncbi:MAG: mycofactocin precursor MftA [Aeromicrobium sp.]|nr:mycofactocin precursor MftA [Aeromicrobium sp.]MDF1706133.1 mycofactocin precursor MftA [Aeromicrobium sp.]